jgi:hypothetical protein
VAGWVESAGIPLLVILWIAAGCSPSEAPPRPLGSQSVVSSADGSAIYGLDTDGGRVVRYVPGAGETGAIEVGAEPTRITRAGDALVVTLRGERGIARLEEGPDGPSVAGAAEIGTEPYGVVADARGDVVYVALSTEDRVVELDAHDFTELRSWSVPGQPRWLAIRPDDRDLYVASAYGGVLTHVDLRDDVVIEIELPEIFVSDDPLAPDLARRLTGDLAITSDGSMLVVPALYADVTTPVETVTPSTSGGGYASAGQSLSRMNPGLTLVPLDGSGDPVPSEIHTVLAVGSATVEAGHFDETVRGYVTSAAIAPDDEIVVATMESSNAFLVMPTRARYGSPLGDGGALADEQPLVVGVDWGPRGVAFAGDRLYVDSFLARSVASVDVGKVRGMVADFDVPNGWLEPGEVTWYESTLPDDVELGRRLFYSSVTQAMSGPGSGISCSTCHFEGRNDGLTWTFEGGPMDSDSRRQTPSLAGEVSLTAPVTWTSAVESVGAEVLLTSQGRMGGEGASDREVAAIEAFVDWTRHADHPGKGASSDAIERGRALFEREDVECATCHVPPTYTDPNRYALYDLDAVNPPSLLGVAVSAPYLHDGRASTLEQVLETTDIGMMGDTSMLTEAEKADLLAFLRSL